MRAKNAALNCVRKALQNHQYQIIKPRIVLVSDTPSFIEDIMPSLMEFSDVCGSEMQSLYCVNLFSVNEVLYHHCRLYILITNHF